MRKLFLITIVIIVGWIVSCAPQGNSVSQEKDAPEDKFFECCPQSVKIKQHDILIDTIWTQIPAFLGTIKYNRSPGGSNCSKSDNSYKDDKILVERLSDMSFKFEYLSNDFSEEIIDLFFYPLDDPTYTHGLVQIYISLDL